MATTIIFARSPYIVSINQALQVGSKIQLFITNGTLPILPTATASKLIASTVNTLNTYNISPYLRDFIKHPYQYPNWNIFSATNVNQYAYLKYKTFWWDGVVYTPIATVITYAVDGYGYYEDGYNPNLGEILLKNKSIHTYAYLPLNPINQWGPGMVTLFTGGGVRNIRYTNLVTGAVFNNSTTATPFTNIYRVYPSFYADGNLLEIFDASFVLLASFTFKPIIECRYEPVVVDFINRYGAWQREFFYKASFETISTKSDVYNLLQKSLPNYSITEGQRREFNNNGLKTIKVNTDYVDESYSEVIQEILLSERVLVNFSPAQLKTRDITKHKKVNTKLINYTLEFEYAFDVINSVV